MIPARRSDWRSRLSAEVSAALGRPFTWGAHDCALFAADAVLAMTGADPASGVRGRYRTAAGAARQLRRAGHPDLAGLAASLVAEIAPAEAVAGDIALIVSSLGPTLGVVTGELIAAPGPQGLNFVPRTEAIRAFRVPFDGEAD